jgi:hypothetical protein
MEKARNAFGWVRDILGVMAIVMLPLIGLAWRAQEQRADDAKAEATVARRELAEFEKWHAETMVRRDYLDARFNIVEQQIAAIKDLIETDKGREGLYQQRMRRYIEQGGK